MSETEPRKTVNIDLPEDYWKRDYIRCVGVSRDAENEKVLMLALSRRPDDDEIRRIHNKLRIVLD